MFQILISYEGNNSLVPYNQLFLIIFFLCLFSRNWLITITSLTFIFIHKDGPDFLFGEILIRVSRYEPCFPATRKILSCQIIINTLLGNDYKIKRGECYTNIHNAVIIYDGIFNLIRSCLWRFIQKRILIRIF